mmetsp:Transcript_35870/g.90185  ORF Transcript_35870/g.90185 Transcript_35870/m.90185 type:complete len:346 (-) Transcript_35870:1603-2640(-)
MCLCNVCDEGLGRSPEQRKVQHSTAEQLQCQLTLHTWRELVEQCRSQRQVMFLAEAAAQVVLDSPPELLWHAPLPHETGGLLDLHLHLIIKQLVHDMGEHRDDATIQERREVGNNGGEANAVETNGGSIITQGGHCQNHPAHVSDVALPHCDLISPCWVDPTSCCDVDAVDNAPKASQKVSWHVDQQKNLHKNNQPPAHLLLEPLQSSPYADHTRQLEDPHKKNAGRRQQRYRARGEKVQHKPGPNIGCQDAGRVVHDLVLADVGRAECDQHIQKVDHVRHLQKRTRDPQVQPTVLCTCILDIHQANWHQQRGDNGDRYDKSVPHQFERRPRHNDTPHSMLGCAI